jgi:hypothetical protein
MRYGFTIAILLAAFGGLVGQTLSIATPGFSLAVASRAPEFLPDPVTIPRSPGPHYGPESGVIEMHVSGMFEGVTTTWFTEHGARSATFSTATFSGVTATSVSIESDGWRIDYDTASRRGTRRPLDSNLTEFGPGSQGGLARLENLSPAERKYWKVRALRSRTLLGRKAKGVQVQISGMVIKAWHWQNIPLRVEMAMGGSSSMVLVVTSLKTDITVPEEMFQVPSDITLTTDE